MILRKEGIFISKNLMLLTKQVSNEYVLFVLQLEKEMSTF